KRGIHARCDTSAQIPDDNEVSGARRARSWPPAADRTRGQGAAAKTGQQPAPPADGEGAPRLKWSFGFIACRLWLWRHGCRRTRMATTADGTRSHAAGDHAGLALRPPEVFWRDCSHT